MTDLKHAVPTKLLWVDLEMTGLDPQQDIILEIAAEITDFDCKPLASYEARIAHPKELVETRMQANTWWNTYPENRDHFIAQLHEGKPLAEVQQDLIDIVRLQFGDEPAILAGNSVHADRGFIEAYWPDLFALLHYRMLDVTAWKVVMQGKYGIEYPKKETHRAFDDIHESMDELDFYLNKLQTANIAKNK